MLRSGTGNRLSVIEQPFGRRRDRAKCRVSIRLPASNMPLSSGAAPIIPHYAARRTGPRLIGRLVPYAGAHLHFSHVGLGPCGPLYSRSHCKPPFKTHVHKHPPTPQTRSLRHCGALPHERLYNANSPHRRAHCDSIEPCHRRRPFLREASRCRTPPPPPRHTHKKQPTQTQLFHTTSTGREKGPTTTTNPPCDPTQWMPQFRGCLPLV